MQYYPIRQVLWRAAPRAVRVYGRYRALRFWARLLGL